ncbi:putative nucleoside-diphosphate-sugar epimerase protein [Rhypophila decipiens]|uniref:Nucleoside-diphosphate-sugar epimerase protein n=1 Tax=Rhypophila decipiens TaxID=261697 RepID=A0AAN6XVS1_9PEZI|nr:putative nucleoside-diphosphate-sugar epimerase protein [Rhypophila decipiens]
MTSERTNIIITGAGGLVGPLLASRLLNEPQYHLVLTDLVDPVVPQGVKYPENAKCMKGDITDPAFVQSLVDAAQPVGAVFIFHGIMSAGSEANFELSLKVNVDSVRLMLDIFRQSAPGVRVIYSSSQAVFGQPLPAVVTENVTPTPMSTYGAHKLMTETYINELNRRGFIEGFIARFPTISVRPGKPTAAASSFLSGIIREPMAGQECHIPIQDREFKSYLTSPSTVAENLMRVLRLDSRALPPHIRHIQFPGVSVSIQEMMDALAKHGGEDKLELLKEETVPDQEAILRSWPQDFDITTPLKLGLKVDSSGEDIIKEYIEGLKQ